MTPDIEAARQRLGAFSTSLVADTLKPHGADRLLMRGVQLRAGQGPVFGLARTLRFLPSRADVTAPPGNLRMRFIDAVGAGEVLVFDAACGPSSSVFGDMVAARARHKGAVAIVTDGAVRDVDAIGELGMAVFAVHVAPAPSAAPLMAWESDVPIQCGGVLVQPGDWIFGDSDGVIVIPATLLSHVLERGETLLRQEAFSRALLDRGHSLAEAFPLPARLQPQFASWLADGRLPDAEVVRGPAPEGPR